ncbi:DUF4649 family protein [Enterococcus pingfangensis]|uniref:DUF4649 family protein n=1 Tax=Enterococcus pingfangensis TaxID=2559924 RepID=UPI0010F61531|nr:DUF4649 family protein [Enterococcus pingfangensis]
MLVITYEANNSEKIVNYPSANDFLAAQLKEVPDLPDYYHVVKVTIEDKEIALQDKTISGLFNHLNK